ncbi:hypothetical protein PIB30_005862 [Stylosanthes scabra]|uniref:Uncharacterized protein n=1 Tax=Stylosanthes scabra TaxID=79078 RepID=A0ABU6Q428_9FABA|nr:hypothetical protein [Stylosanthes scabra]
MSNQDEEGVVYTDHSSDEQRRNQHIERQPEDLDLNASANDETGIGDDNIDSGGVQNRQPQPHTPNPRVKTLHAGNGTRGQGTPERERGTQNHHTTAKVAAPDAS